MNRSPWRLEEVDGGDEQYPAESHFAVRHTPPDEQDPRFVCFAVRHTPPNQQDPCFDRRRSVSSVLRYSTPLPINRTPVLTVGGLFPPFCGTLGLVSITYSVQAGWLPRVPLPPDEHDAFRCIPMNMTHSVASR